MSNEKIDINRIIKDKKRELIEKELEAERAAAKSAEAEEKEAEPAPVLPAEEVKAEEVKKEGDKTTEEVKEKPKQGPAPVAEEEKKKPQEKPVKETIAADRSKTYINPEFLNSGDRRRTGGLQGERKFPPRGEGSRQSGFEKRPGQGGRIQPVMPTPIPAGGGKSPADKKKKSSFYLFLVCGEVQSVKKGKFGTFFCDHSL